MPKQILHTALFHYPHHLSSMLANADGNLHAVGAHHGGTFLINSYIAITRFKIRLLNLSLGYKIAILSSLIFIPFFALLALFMMPKTVNYSFAGTNCFSSPMVLPNLANSQTSNTFKITKNPKLSVADYPIVSTSSCIELSDAPAENLSQTAKFKAFGFIDKNININVGKLPKLNIETSLSEPVSPKENIIFSLNQADKTFNYSILVDSQETDCKVLDKSVSCTLQNFKLEQGKKYDLVVNRTFNNTSEAIFEDTVALRDPVAFVQSSITNNQIVYENPKSITITANKELSDLNDVKLTSSNVELPLKTSIKGEVVELTPESPLPRDSNLTLTIGSASATDGAFLSEPYKLDFKTSGGPKVIGVNVKSYDVSSTNNIVFTFDVGIANEQDLTKFVALNSHSDAVPAIISSYENTITINPTQILAACNGYNLLIKDGLANQFGVSGGSEWTMSFRTTCKQVFSIGTSVQGRALTAYKYGSGGKSIVFVGGMHGNERSSYKTLIAWVDELERRYHEIPADKTIYVIPDANPDGYAHQTRTNANGIDLNRNFPSNDWTSGVYLPGDIYLENGGGSSALSEPESSALATFINSIGPRVVLTYHAVDRSVFSNGAGDSAALSSLYASKSGYANYNSSHEDGVFNYPTTGELETWLADKKSIPTLLVELSSMGNNELSSQRSAMWSMLGI